MTCSPLPDVPLPSSGLTAPASWQQQAVEHSPNAIFLVSPSGHIAASNAAAREHFGDGLTGRSYTELLLREEAPRLQDAVARVLRGGTLSGVKLNYNAAQGVQAMLSRFYPYFVGAEVHGCIIASTDISGLEHDAFHDALTGLPNRALFLDRLAQAVERSKRHRTQGFAVLFLDFDRFKVINDSLGHAVGDALLIALGERLGGCVRPVDTVARLGGDEFTILLTDVPVTSEAVRTAERIRTALEKPFCLGDYEVKMSASIGIVPSELGYNNANEVLRDADIAMYRAKLGGRARHQLFGLAMRDEALRRLELESDLRAAVAQGTLGVAYQPITEIATGRPTGFEALVRWEHPRYGSLEPTDFIPLAEETGLIVELDRLILRRACTQVRLWQRQFPSLPPLTLSANLSSRQFSCPDLAEWLEELLIELDFEPHNLHLELTESVFMAASAGVIETLTELRKLGVQLHIDDFGTGYSSLSYLKNLPVSTLKIDRSFVTRMGESAESSELVQTIVAMAKALGLQVTAAGIETGVQLEQLRRLGCEYGQGYLFAEPLSPAQTEAFMVAQAALAGA